MNSNFSWCWISKVSLQYVFTQDWSDTILSDSQTYLQINFHMNKLVWSQIPLGVTSLSTCCTYKWLLSSMYSHVICQIGGGGERLSTIATIKATKTVRISVAVSCLWCFACTYNDKYIMMIKLTKEQNPVHKTSLFKILIGARSNLLLNISLAGGQSLKWINHECKAWMIYPLTTDWQAVIY